MTTPADNDKIGQYGQVILWQLEGVSTSAIARRLGVARSTLYLWRDDPVFRGLEVEALRQSRSAAVSDIKAAVVAAAKTVREIMTKLDLNPKVSAVRLAAAKVVLENAGIIKSAGDSPLDTMSDDELDDLAAKIGYTRAPAADAGSGETH